MCAWAGPAVAPIHIAAAIKHHHHGAKTRPTSFALFTLPNRMPIRNLVFMPRRTSWGAAMSIVDRILWPIPCSRIPCSENNEISNSICHGTIFHIHCSLQTSYKRVLARTDWLTDVFSSESDRQVERADGKSQMVLQEEVEARKRRRGSVFAMRP